MAGEYGIKETTEVMTALGDVGAVVMKEVRAGGAPAEIGLRVGKALSQDPQLLEDVRAAAEGIAEVPAELHDLSLREILSLGGCALDQVRKAVE